MEAREYKRVRVHSSIDGLPQGARESLEAMIADATNGLSYRDMGRIIEEQCGMHLSISAIGRYAKRYMREVRQIDLIMKRMQAVSEYVREYGTENAGACINALIQEGLMRRILDGAEDIADMDIKDALRYSIQAQRAAVYEHRYKDECIVREDTEGAETEEKRLEWLRGVLRSNPDMMRELAAELMQEEAQGAQVTEYSGGYERDERLQKDHQG